MKYNLRNSKGNILVLACVALPVFIACIGMCLDGSMLVYYQAKLMVATKLAAVSASSDYKVDDEGNIIIKANESFVENVLSQNFNKAKLRSFIINDSAKNKCTVITEAKVDFVFMKAFNINSKTISDSYTATRK